MEGGNASRVPNDAPVAPVPTVAPALCSNPIDPPPITSTPVDPDISPIGSTPTGINETLSQESLIPQTPVRKRSRTRSSNNSDSSHLSVDSLNVSVLPLGQGEAMSDSQEMNNKDLGRLAKKKEKLDVVNSKLSPARIVRKAKKN